MHSYDTTFRARLLKKIAEKREDLKTELEYGYFTQNKSAECVGMEYRFRVGQLAALSEIERLMEDVTKEMMES